MPLPTESRRATENSKTLAGFESTHATDRSLPMRQIVLTALAPFIVFGALGIAVTYPGPSDLWASVQPVPAEMRIVNSGGQREDAIVRNIANYAPAPVARQSVENADCFQDLALASTAKLDRCASVVYQALIDIERESKRPVLTGALTTASTTRVVNQLRYAAAEVCRSVWTNEPVKSDLASPACAIAEIRVASDVQ